MVSLKFVARSPITKANAADAVNRAADDLIQFLEKLIAKKCLIKQGALLNAVVHKDYSSGNPVQISVYEDKIIFWNAGRLPDELSLELLQKKHPSIPYNPLVASAFFRAGYIEAWGRGIEKINNECKMAGVPAPEINYAFAGLMITFQARIGETGKISPEATPKTRGKTREKTREKILKLILEDTPIQHYL